MVIGRDAARARPRHGWVADAPPTAVTAAPPEVAQSHRHRRAINAAPTAHKTRHGTHTASAPVFDDRYHSRPVTTIKTLIQHARMSCKTNKENHKCKHVTTSRPCKR